MREQPAARIAGLHKGIDLCNEVIFGSKLLRDSVLELGHDAPKSVAIAEKVGRTEPIPHQEFEIRVGSGSRSQTVF